MKKLVLLFSLLLVTIVVMAMPAKKGIWKTITLENGQEVKAQLMGDEFGHYWCTVDGKHYVAVGSQYLEETPDIRQEADRRRAEAQQRRAARLPNQSADGVRRAPDTYTGNKKGLILLVNFQDTKFQAQHNRTLYNNVANTPGYTDDNGFIGSVADYFKDQSRNQFVLTFDVIGPVTVSKDAKYYGENTTTRSDEHAPDMVVEAIKLAKDQVTNWKQYDWDRDGEVDQVMIIYAGEGEADSGNPDTIWPHEARLSYYNLDFEVVEGIRVNTFGVSNEGRAQTDSETGEQRIALNGIGTICHEFSHCLGLKDLYDTRGGGNYGMGRWSLMDNGGYNGDGFIPSGYTSFDKYIIGWIEPIELTSEQEVKNMSALSDADDVYIIKNPAHPYEYYLLENRQKKGWDADVPSEGMLILHVDYNPTIWSYNIVNTFYDGYNDHQRCTIFHADGIEKSAEYYAKLAEAIVNFYNAETYEESSYYYDQWYYYWYLYDADMRNDVYPQPDNNQLTNTSVPRAFLYNENEDGRKLMNISITEITQNDNGTIDFKFAPDNSGSGEEGDNTAYSYSGIPTAIHTVKTADNKTTRIYTLDGRYVGSDYQQLGRGIYIVNGRKVVK